MRIERFVPNTYSPQVMAKEAQESAQSQTQTSDPARTSDHVGKQITDAINHVNGLQKQADGVIGQVATGNPEDVHKAMVTMEHALMALDFTVQIRNKMLEAYQEIMRTQV